MCLCLYMFRQYSFNVSYGDTPVIPLGAFGGLLSSSCSCYKIKHTNIFLDAGCLGKLTTGIVPQDSVFLLTHSHLDHISGLIYFLKTNPNYRLTIYTDMTKENIKKLTGITHTHITIKDPSRRGIQFGIWKLEKCFLLRHGYYSPGSYVFILLNETNTKRIFYFGDFDLENSEAKTKFGIFLKYIDKNPRIGYQTHVFMECAIPTCVHEKTCFGHLNITDYAKCIGLIRARLNQTSLTFYVTHRKPSFKVHGGQVTVNVPTPIYTPHQQLLKHIKEFECKNCTKMIVKNAEYDHKSQTVTLRYNVSDLGGKMNFIIQIPPITDLSNTYPVDIRLEGVDKTPAQKFIKKICNGKYWPGYQYLFSPNMRVICDDGSFKKEGADKKWTESIKWKDIS